MISSRQLKLNYPQCLNRFLDGQKRTAANLVFQAFEGFLEPKTKQKFNSREGFFFRKSSFCTFSCKKSWIWQTLGHVMDILSYFPFSYCFKRMLLAKKIQISCMGLKVPFWKNWKIAKIVLLSIPFNYLPCICPHSVASIKLDSKPECWACTF